MARMPTLSGATTPTRRTATKSARAPKTGPAASTCSASRRTLRTSKDKLKASQPRHVDKTCRFWYAIPTGVRMSPNLDNLKKNIINGPLRANLTESDLESYATLVCEYFPKALELDQPLTLYS